MQDSLNAELKEKHDFAVHIASPGMVATELLLGGERDPRAARIINILAEEAEVVAAWMVPRMRGIRGNGRYFKCALWPHKRRCAALTVLFLEFSLHRPGNASIMLVRRMCSLLLCLLPGAQRGPEQAHESAWQKSFTHPARSASYACPLYRFLTPRGVLWRFLTARGRKGRFISELPKTTA